MSLKERLDRVAREGALSTADLAAWFDLSYHTMRSYRYATEPQEPRRPQIEQRLAWLEDALDNGTQLPVPISIRRRNRRAYLSGIRRSYEHP